MSTTTAPTQPVIFVEELGTAARDAAARIEHERCDSCGHRAYVVTVVPSAAGPMPLSWCAHHFEAVGKGTGAVAIDIRSRLAQAPGASAGA